MGMRSELGPECKASRARVGITERSPDDTGMRCEMDERECKQVASQEIGNCSANIAGRVGLVCMTITLYQNYNCIFKVHIQVIHITYLCFPYIADGGGGHIHKHCNTLKVTIHSRV